MALSTAVKEFFGKIQLLITDSDGAQVNVVGEDDGTPRSQLVLWDTQNEEQIRASATTEGALKVFLANALGGAMDSDLRRLIELELLYAEKDFLQDMRTTERYSSERRGTEIR